MGPEHRYLKRTILFLSGLALWLFRGLFRLLPHRVAVGLGAVVGTLVYAVARRRRALALANLGAAFPEKEPQQIAEMAKRVFENFGRTAAEFLRTRHLSAETVSNLVEIEGLEKVDRALQEGKGALMITAHFGNWELMARYLTDRGYRLSVVARDANDPRTTEIVNEIRRENGYQVFSRGNAAKFILGCLRRNELVGILPDQNAGDVFLRFFGRECGSVVGPAVIHLRTGAPLIPIFCVRLPGDRHRIEVHPPIETALTGDTDRDAKAIMEEVQAAIERQVRRYPDQWLWFHDRWKSARRREEAAGVG